MTYADYSYYTEQFMGRAISEEDFPRLALRASQYLDTYTQGRAAENAEADALKMACCALAEKQQVIEAAQELAQSSLKTGEHTESGELESEKIGSWARKFRSGGESATAAQEAAERARRELTEIARLHLTGTGLLYRGGR